jgi:hypothetical protein
MATRVTRGVAYADRIAGVEAVNRLGFRCMSSADNIARLVTPVLPAADTLKATTTRIWSRAW